MRRWCVGIKREPALNGGFRWGFRWGFRPPHDGVLLVALGVAPGVPPPPPRRGAIGCAGGYWCNKKDLVLIFFIFVFFIYASSLFLALV